MSADEQRSLADYGATIQPDEPTATETDGQAQRPDCGRDEDGSGESGLAAIFFDVSGVTTITETHEETPSHAAIEGDADEVPDLTEDGLEDAADSDYNGGLW